MKGEFENQELNEVIAPGAALIYLISNADHLGDIIKKVNDKFFKNEKMNSLSEGLLWFAGGVKNLQKKYPKTWKLIIVKAFVADPVGSTTVAAVNKAIDAIADSFGMSSSIDTKEQPKQIGLGGKEMFSSIKEESYDRIKTLAGINTKKEQ